MSSTSAMEAKTKIDEYIATSPNNFRTICEKLRQIIRQADPEIKETWKWSAPVYEKNQLICSYSFFKKHVRLSFFQGAFLSDPEQIFIQGEGNATMRGINFTDVSQLDESTVLTITNYVKEAANLNKPKTKPVAKELAVPADLTSALERNELAKIAFQNLSHTHRKEYILWIEGAKKAETRQRRIEKALTDLAINKNKQKIIAT